MLSYTFINSHSQVSDPGPSCFKIHQWLSIRSFGSHVHECLALDGCLALQGLHNFQESAPDLRGMG